MRGVCGVAAMFAVVLVSAVPVRAEDKCIFKSYAFESFDNEAVDVEMTVKAGKLCGITLGSTGGYVHGTTITRAPAHGAAMARSLYVVYRSVDRYRGPDRFTYVRDVTIQTGGRVKRTVNVLVTVVP